MEYLSSLNYSPLFYQVQLENRQRILFPTKYFKNDENQNFASKHFLSLDLKPNQLV